MKNVMSIDLGGTNLRIGIVNENLEILDIKREPTTKNDKEGLFSQICRMIDSLDYKKYDVTKVGISACGLVEHDVVRILPNLGIKDFDLKAMLEKKYGFKVEIKNDANCTALAEASFGSTKDARDSYFITISTGIGGCLIYDHKMVDLAFEIGHTSMLLDGKLVKFENKCSGNGIVKSCKELGLDIPHAGMMFEMKDSNEIAHKVYEEWMNIVSLFLANTQMQFNLDKIVLSGGVMKSSKYFFDELEKRANAIIADFPLKKIKLVLAHFDQDAGLMGGVSVAFAIQ